MSVALVPEVGETLRSDRDHHEEVPREGVVEGEARDGILLVFFVQT